MVRLAAVVALITQAVFAAEVQVDHVTVCGAQVKTLQSGLEAVGIPSVYGGAHTNKTTEMALVSLPDGSYLELMGEQPGATPQLVDQHEWGKFLKANAGPCAWALRSKDLSAEVGRLKAAGVTVGEPVKSGRARPDGVKLDWETLQIGEGPRGNFFPFLIHDFTDRNDRAFPQKRPSTRDFKGVAKIVIAVRNLDDAIERYRKAFGQPPPIKQVDKEFGAQMALMGGMPVVLAQPLTADSWLTERIEKFGEAPCAFVLAALSPGKYRAAAKSRWFGTDISWFDSGKLGWRLGFEAGR
jgi:hypothetical protein